MNVSWLAGAWRRMLAHGPGSTAWAEASPPPDGWDRIREVLNTALDLPPAGRGGFLDRACAGRPELRREVESLLAVHEQPGLLDGAAADLAAPLLTAVHPAPAIRGRTGSQYEVMGELGSGGMGVVYRARDLRLGRLVALKFLPPHLGTDPRAKERLLLEAQAAAALDHPQICTIHEIGETAEGQLFLAMPLYDGETLKQRIGRGSVSVSDAVDLAMQALHGLAHAHERGIIHRDIKPANLMVSTQGIVKILDFGIAKLADNSVTGPGIRPGTVAYMSPEQASGTAVDPRTDLWSLGVVLYEMLTGRRPFEGEPEQAVVGAILHSAPDPVTALRPDVPAGLGRVLDRATAKRPADRYDSAHEMARDLERVSREGGVRPSRSSSLDRGQGSTYGRPSEDREPGAGVLPEGERRQVTIVASTISGYPQLVEQLTPDRLDGALGELKRAADDVARRHGGVLNRFAGDRMIFLFGIPTTHEDDTLRAVRAARELYQRFEAWGASADLGSAQAPCVHIGIDTGQVVAQQGDGHESRYRIVGTPVQIAEWLATRAGGSEIWVGPDCLRFVEPIFETDACESLTVQGRTQPLVPRRIVRESGLQSRLEAAQEAQLTRYVGRREERAALRRSLQAAVAGSGRLVTIVGEAGIGKSRLLREFRRELNPGQVLLLRGRCQSWGTGTAYLPFVEALQGGLGVDEACPPERVVERTVDHVREIGPELEEFIPFYLHLLASPSAEYPVPRHLYGEQLRLAMQEALCAFFTLSAVRQPTVVQLEDWHWVDDASYAVLEELAEMVADYPLLLVVTCRPGYLPDRRNPGQHALLSLQPLDPSASLAMLSSVLRVDRFPEELGLHIHERTGGNPFFLEEICQALVEEGTLSAHRDRVTLTGSLETLELPDTIQAVIRSRLDRLEPAAREVVRLASVVGREFSRRVLERTLPEVGRLPNALQVLKGSGLIHQTRVVPDAAYRFKHTLIQETAYLGLLEHQRRQLHGVVGEAIEELYGSRLDDYLDRLADHFSRAQRWEKAVHYGVRAAQRTAGLNQFSEALQLLDRAIGWLAQLADGTDARATRIGILLEQERLCETLGERGRQQRIIDELIAILARAGDRAVLAEVYVRQGDLYTLLRRFQPAEAALTESLRLRRELGDEVGERNTLRSLGLLRWHEDRNEEALKHIEAALAIDRRRDDLEAVVGDLSNQANVYKALGKHERAKAGLEEALGLTARAPTDPTGSVGGPALAFKHQYILHNLANIHRELGEDEQAVEWLNRAIELTGKRMPIQLSYHYTSLAHIRLRQGRIEESIALYRQAIELTRKPKFGPGLSLALRLLGEVLLGLGRAEEALPYLKEASGIYAQLKDRETEAQVWSSIAAVHEQRENYTDAMAAWANARALHRQTNDPAAELVAVEAIARLSRRHLVEPSLALAYYREALHLARTLGDTAAEGRLHNTLGILEWSQSDFEGALEHFEQGLDLFRTQGDERSAGLMLNSIGVTLKALGRRSEARQRLEEAIALHREQGASLLEGHALAVLGDLAAESGDTDEALDRYDCSLALRRQVGDRSGEGWMLHQLARVHLERGAPDRAREPAARAAHIAGELGLEDLSGACEDLRRMFGL